KVRGGEKTGVMASGATDRICHGTNRAFPIRAGDVDNLRWKTQLQFTQQTPDILEAKFDSVTLGRVKPRQGFAIVHAAGAKNWRNCAICGRNLLRSTIWSINPCSFRNSAVWNPFGRSWCVVSLITRGPAKPIMLFGSAIITSPSEAKLAITPAVVGFVRTEMYGSRPSAWRASAALVFAICIKLNIPSHMRAPPEAE